MLGCQKLWSMLVPSQRHIIWTFWVTQAMNSQYFLQYLQRNSAKFIRNTMNQVCEMTVVIQSSMLITSESLVGLEVLTLMLIVESTGSLLV